jgi:hypothetical protein
MLGVEECIVGAWESDTRHPSSMPDSNIQTWIRKGHLYSKCNLMLRPAGLQGIQKQPNSLDFFTTSPEQGVPHGVMILRWVLLVLVG